ncbi:MAG: ribokinase, partial [Spirochaetales bacterium]
MGRVAVVGSINMDLVVHTPRMPRIGETIIGSNFMTACGGKGGNQALAASRLGGQVSMLGCVGEDAFAPELRANLEAAGVDTAAVHTTGAAATGTATIVVYEGDNFIIIDPGANHHITRAHVQAFGEVISASDIVLIQLEIPLDIVAETVRVSAECGTPVLLNPAPAAELDSETLAGITWFTPNEGEAATIAGLGG